jgi:hypothetical protein
MSPLVIPTWVIERWTEVGRSVVVIHLIMKVDANLHMKSKEEKAWKKESWLETILFTILRVD